MSRFLERASWAAPHWPTALYFWVLERSRWDFQASRAALADEPGAVPAQPAACSLQSTVATVSQPPAQPGLVAPAGKKNRQENREKRIGKLPLLPCPPTLPTAHCPLPTAHCPLVIASAHPPASSLLQLRRCFLLLQHNTPCPRNVILHHHPPQFRFRFGSSCP